MACCASPGAQCLVRELQESGSDMITEVNLTEVFGRKTTECNFESTFHSAVEKICPPQHV